MRESLRALREAGDTETFEGMEPDGDLPPFITPDDLISARVDGAEFVQRKMDGAGRAPHPGARPTARSSAAARAATRSGARSATGSSAARRSPARTGYETDLFAGL